VAHHGALSRMLRSNCFRDHDKNLLPDWSKLFHHQSSINIIKHKA